MEPLHLAGTLTLSAVAFLVFYHHIAFPMFLKRVAQHRRKQKTPRVFFIPQALPKVTILMPAYNEGPGIAEKIANLVDLDYPRDKLKIIVACDGCTDDTVDQAQASAGKFHPGGPEIEVIDHETNRGKIAVLNEHLPRIRSGIIALTDVSAKLPKDALTKAAVHFQNRHVGVVAATYRLSNPSSAGEAAYWNYQVAIKEGEAALGAPLGVHGALYFIRAGLFRPLPADTINDDFIIPMQIVADGAKSIYDPTIVATELEIASLGMDFRRRKRIAAGNMQQAVRMAHLLMPWHGGIALSFFSGKALRAVMPFLLMAFTLISAALAFLSPVWLALVGIEISVLGITLWRQKHPNATSHKLIDLIHYIVSGHFAGLIGGSRYLLGLERGGWRRATTHSEEVPMTTTSNCIQSSKRIVDVFGAFVGLGIGAVFAPFVCLAIKLDSRGPVLFKQIRVGRTWPTHTELFHMYKFRTMRADAEKLTGPVWATKDDPRITRVGKFLRKTRLDEIPQLINVLKGDMSLIGPRPERPGICDKLETAIPYYAERTYGVRPGITGLAQVFQGYDETVEDVRSKVSYDHAYALAIGNWRNWIMMDLEILYRTVGVVFGARGQ